MVRVDTVIDRCLAKLNEGIGFLDKEALRASILLGFLRHGQEGLNNGRAEGARETARYG
jgi:hypothetical protein